DYAECERPGHCRRNRKRLESRFAETLLKSFTHRQWFRKAFPPLTGRAYENAEPAPEHFLRPGFGCEPGEGHRARQRLQFHYLLAIEGPACVCDRFPPCGIPRAAEVRRRRLPSSGLFRANQL